MLTVSLFPDLEAYIEEAVAAGKYESPSEMVVHALYLLKAQDQLHEIQLEDLRREVAIGLEQCERGEVKELDIEEIIAAARERLAAEQARERPTKSA